LTLAASVLVVQVLVVVVVQWLLLSVCGLFNDGVTAEVYIVLNEKVNDE
jgi:hypothetical protein